MNAKFIFRQCFSVAWETYLFVTRAVVLLSTSNFFYNIAALCNYMRLKVKNKTNVILASSCELRNGSPLTSSIYPYFPCFVSHYLYH